MTSATADRIPRTADGVPLKVKLRRAERRRQLKAVGLVLPLFLFIVIAFVVPIGVMLFNAVHDDTLLTLMPKTTAALASWDGKDLPDEAVYRRPGRGSEGSAGRTRTPPRPASASTTRFPARAAKVTLERAQGQQARPPGPTRRP